MHRGQKKQITSRPDASGSEPKNKQNEAEPRRIKPEKLKLKMFTLSALVILLSNCGGAKYIYNFEARTFL
jgi:hypothetical protein